MYLFYRFQHVCFMEFRYRLVIFLISFSVGILYVYMVTPHRRAIVKYPTPFNAGKVVYKDMKRMEHAINTKQIKPIVR